jgi:hypothetical protein
MSVQQDRIGVVTSASRASSRRFIVTFSALVLPALAFFVGFSLLQDPVKGDLTRVGGYSENDFGWNAAHKRFHPPLVSYGYDRPHDIVIVGDSYSAWAPDQQTDPGAYWTNHLAQRSGLAVAVVNVHHMTVRALIEHPVFTARPPRLLILQIVERYIPRNLVTEVHQWAGSGFDGCPVPGPSPRVELARPLAAAPLPWKRDTSVEFNFARAVDVLWESTRRRLDAAAPTRAHDLPLSNGALFSSVASDRLLVYDEEFEDADWPPERIAAMRCRLRAIQAAVEANGRTAFLFVAPPNKLTVYAEHVSDPRFRNISKLDEIAADPHLNQVRLLEPMREAVRCGAVDLYLPNDTHLGTPGHELVARATLEAIARPGSAQQPPGRMAARCDRPAAPRAPG